MVDEPGRLDRVVGGGMVALMLGWPKCMEIRLFRGLLATKSRLRRPVFVFLLGGPGPL